MNGSHLANLVVGSPCLKAPFARVGINALGTKSPQSQSSRLVCPCVCWIRTAPPRTSVDRSCSHKHAASPLLLADRPPPTYTPPYTRFRHKRSHSVAFSLTLLPTPDLSLGCRIESQTGTTVASNASGRQQLSSFWNQMCTRLVPYSFHARGSRFSLVLDVSD